MPRWKALPDELDPQVREFASQLRRLVDRSGLSIATVADRTGYSKTSWERYLGGRLLPPEGAVVSLAEVTGANPAHLTTMWELAERAWSRSEMRHDVTMEAIRVAQARAALGEFGAPAAKSGHRGTARPQAAPPAGPAHGYHPTGAVRPAPPGDGPRGRGRSRRVPMFIAGAVGGLLVVAAVVLLLDLGGNDEAGAVKMPPSPTASQKPEVPAGVKCTGDDCSGADPEAMGCGGQYAQTVADGIVGGAFIEVRYSEVCKAAWARITEAAPGDTVRIVGAKQTESGTADQGGEAYTMMVAVSAPGGAKACAETSAGVSGCTRPGREQSASPGGT
ncbi:helix-turn-helix domain-containing protein [Streptomyces sp. KR80]|uniref:helix-turn-helix domain-containing protein n=1 Tax=Streptomyces sp. KR80 TaxID=3457426 RepID=UPI003FCEFCCE